MLQDLAKQSGNAMSEPSSAIALPIQETFQSTIQGEGYWSGALVDFIRLHGCPVQCPWCDQEYGEGGKHLPRSLVSIPDLPRLPP